MDTTLVGKLNMKMYVCVYVRQVFRWRQQAERRMTAGGKPGLSDQQVMYACLYMYVYVCMYVCLYMYMYLYVGHHVAMSIGGNL